MGLSKYPLWVILLTSLLLVGMGLQGLPVPCQNGHCGAGLCGTAADPCPPNCTCHVHPVAAVPPCCIPTTEEVATVQGTATLPLCHAHQPADTVDTASHAPHVALSEANHAPATPIAHADAHGHAPAPISESCQRRDGPNADFPHFSLPRSRLAALLQADVIPVFDSPRSVVEPQAVNLASRTLAPRLRPPTA